MKKVLVFIGIGLVLLIAIIYGLYVMFMGGPSESLFAEYVDPGIHEIPDQKVILVKMTGPPEVAAGKAIELLFNAYYQIPEIPKAGYPPAPRARWYSLSDEPKENWKSEFAMPVPNAVESLSFSGNAELSEVELGLWEYGPTAVILHKGGYDAEEPTVKKLTDYIHQEGYEIIGAHEEEYVKGPMPLLFRGPDNYLTLIRYRVKKIE